MILRRDFKLPRFEIYTAIVRDEIPLLQNPGSLIRPLLTQSARILRGGAGAARRGRENGQPLPARSRGSKTRNPCHLQALMKRHELL